MPPETFGALRGERQPLLPQKPTTSHHEHGQDEETGAVTEEVVEIKSSARKTLWYIVLSLVVIFVLVLFIKGFIDADDVEVREVFSSLTVRRLMSCLVRLQKSSQIRTGRWLEWCCGCGILSRFDLLSPLTTTR